MDCPIKHALDFEIGGRAMTTKLKQFINMLLAQG